MLLFDIENPYSWLISSRKKSFIVLANSDRERQEWLAHLDRCIRSASGMSRRILSTISVGFSLQMVTKFNKLKLLHIGFPMIKPIHVCIVIQRNSRPIIANMYERNQ